MVTVGEEPEAPEKGQTTIVVGKSRPKILVGYATYDVDRIGTGASSRSLSLVVTDSLQALAIHDSITALRAGAIGGRRFTDVVLGAHPLGSVIAIAKATTYLDEPAVLLTGVSHQLDPVGLTGIFASLYPAALDPAFSAPLFRRRLPANLRARRGGTRRQPRDGRSELPTGCRCVG